jgi:hypothetical protein
MATSYVHDGNASEAWGRAALIKCDYVAFSVTRQHKSELAAYNAKSRRNAGFEVFRVA